MSRAVIAHRDDVIGPAQRRANHPVSHRTVIELFRMAEMDDVVDGHHRRDSQKIRKRKVRAMEEVVLGKRVTLPQRKEKIFLERIFFRRLAQELNFVEPANLRRLTHRAEPVCPEVGGKGALISGFEECVTEEKREGEVDQTLVFQREQAIDEIFDVDSDTAIAQLAGVNKKSKCHNRP